MINRLILANLRNRPMRSLVSVVAVAIEVILILLIVGLVNGMVHDHRARTHGLGADIMVLAGNGSIFAEMSGNTLPVKLADVFAKVPGVGVVAPVSYNLIGGMEAVGGVDLSTFDAVSGGFRMVKGREISAGANEVMVDDLEAEAKHYHVGQTLNLFGRPFTLVGVFEHGMGSRIYIPLDVMYQVSGAPGKVSTFYIRVAPGAVTKAVVARLQKMAPGEKVISMQDYITLLTPSTLSPALPIFQRVMVGVAMAIGFLVIFLSLYTTVLERTREIGILKALGASRGYIVRIILRESELLAIVGIILGTVATYILWIALARLYPTLTMEFTWQWIGFAALIAVASSTVGALYPAYKAAGQDAIAALAYE